VVFGKRVLFIKNKEGDRQGSLPKNLLIIVLLSSLINMLPRQSLGGVPGINDKAPLGSDPGIIIGGVICHQQDQVSLLQNLRGERNRGQIDFRVMSHPKTSGDVKVIIT
jgi:hypothetical protein